jgi:pimeloyl-ACP methyl ester carboxylesterase
MTTRNRAAQPLVAKLIRQFDPQVGKLMSGHLARYDLISNAVAAKLPILLLRGGLDRAVNAALKPTLYAMSGLPHFTLRELPRGGHCANLDDTDAWRSVLMAFWARAGGRG